MLTIRQNLFVVGLYLSSGFVQETSLKMCWLQYFIDSYSYSVLSLLSVVKMWSSVSYAVVSVKIAGDVSSNGLVTEIGFGKEKVSPSQAKPK